MDVTGIYLLSRIGTFIILIAIIVHQASGQNYVLRSSCDGSVQAGDNCTLSCDTRNTTYSVIQWLNRTVTRVVRKSTCTPSSPFPSDYSITCPTGNSTVYTVTFTNAQFQRDTLSWRCDFGFGGRGSNTVDILVNVPLTSVSISRSNTSITCVATSSGKPSITLYRDGRSEITSAPAVEGSAGWTATLVYSLSGDRAKSIYWCEGSNGKTTVNSTFSFPEGPPDPPTDVSVTSDGTSVYVSWLRGYNGGFTQTFTVEYSRDKATWTTGGTEKEVEELEYYKTVISDLEPATQYFVRVRAQNLLGDSPYTGILSVTTDVEHVVSETPRTDNLGTGIGIGLGICMPFIAALVVIVILMYRRINTAKNLRHSNQLQTDKGFGDVGPPASADRSTYDGLDNTSRTQDYAELKLYENPKA